MGHPRIISHLLFRSTNLPRFLLNTVFILLMFSALASPGSANACRDVACYVSTGDAVSTSTGALTIAHNTNLLLPSAETTLAPVQTAAIYADDALPGDRFGSAVAIDGDTAVIGARAKSLDSPQGALAYSGAAYVFIRKDGFWYQVARLTANDAKAYDSFGTSVGISGNTIVVGATGVDIGGAENAGAVYVFRGSGGNWAQTARLEASDPTEEANLGSSVAIDRFTIIAGANGKYVASYPDVGGAYIFGSGGGQAWVEQAILQPAAILPGTYFGTSVAVSGSYAIIGATEANSPGSRKGRAYVYARNGNKWSQDAVLAAEGGGQGDFFGLSVSISGNSAVVGAAAADPDLGQGQIWNAGAAYVFTRKGGAWKQEDRLTAKDAESFDRFGASVGISGNTILVGATGKTFFGQLNAGTAYLFARSDQGWEQQSRINASNPASYEEFGHDVSIDGDSGSIGMPGGSPNSITLAGEAYAMRFGQAQLPDTGFAPGRITALPMQPPNITYRAYGEVLNRNVLHSNILHGIGLLSDASQDNMWLEIPSLEVHMPIVGVSKGGNGWDVRWLSDQAGFLEGTAFPTWAGNTALAGHAVLPSGEPGPFAGLQNLRWGDRLIIHAWGQRYIYEVRQNELVSPGDLSVLKHEDLDWVTLITCQDFDETRQAYQWRRIARAVLINILPED